MTVVSIDPATGAQTTLLPYSAGYEEFGFHGLDVEPDGSIDFGGTDGEAPNGGLFHFDPNTGAVTLLFNEYNPSGGPNTLVGGFATGPDVWTGSAPDDNLWSDGANWQSGQAPSAGDDLVFPSDALQQTNVDDLGYTFSSVTIQGGSYEFSGQPLEVTKTLSVQSGTLTLDNAAAVDASATLSESGVLVVSFTGSLDDDGSATVSANATLIVQGNLFVGSGATLDDEGNMTVAAYAILTDNNALTVGNSATLEDEGTLIIAANATLTDNNSVTVGINGYNGYLDDEGILTVAPDATLTETASPVNDNPNDVVTFAAPNVATPPNVQLDNANYGIADTLQSWSVNTSLVNAVLVAQGYSNPNGWYTNGTTVPLADDAAFNVVNSNDLRGYLLASSGGNPSSNNALNENMNVTLDVGATSAPTGATEHWLQIINEDQQYAAGNGPYGFPISGQQGFWGIDNGDLDAGTAGSDGSSPTPFYDEAFGWTATNIGDNPTVVMNGQVGNYLHFYDIPVWDVQTPTSDSVYLANTGFTWGFTVTPPLGIKIGTMGTLFDQGNVNVGAGAILDDNGVLNVPGTLTISGLVEITVGATLNSEGSVIVEASGVLSDQDAITVGTASTLNVFGTLIEGAGGVENLYGTLIIEQGATLDVVGTLDIFGSATIDAGANYSPLGTVTIEPGGTLNILSAPEVSSVSPATGPAAGGTTVDIYGTGFTGATAVSFGSNAAASFTVDSDTQITAVDPAGAGRVDVTVSVPGSGVSATSPADDFTYITATTTSLTSNPVGPITEGTSVSFIATIGGTPSVGTVSFYYDYGAPDQIQIGDAVDVTGGSATSATTTVLPAGSDTITAIYSGGTGFAESQGTLTIQVSAPPSISNVAINQDITSLYDAAGQPFAGAQRSMVNDIVYTFSEPVTILDPSVNPTVFTIAVASGWTGTVPTLSWASVAGSGDTEWAVTFSGNGVTGGSIANGAYTITVADPGSITAESDDQALSLASSGIGGGTQSFFRLFGDINGDEFVNAADNVKFKQALTTYNAAFDYSQDGFVNAADNAKFKTDLTVNFTGFTPTI
jgi:IPT/TIG domain/Bacterial Ig-like domain (group 3)